MHSYVELKGGITYCMSKGGVSQLTAATSIALAAACAAATPARADDEIVLDRSFALKFGFEAGEEVDLQGNRLKIMLRFR